MEPRRSESDLSGDVLGPRVMHSERHTLLTKDERPRSEVAASPSFREERTPRETPREASRETPREKKKEKRPKKELKTKKSSRHSKNITEDEIHRMAMLLWPPQSSEDEERDLGARRPITPDPRSSTADPQESQLSDTSKRSSSETDNNNSLSPTVFVDPPSHNFMCPLHGDFFVEPVVADCGHTFCRGCLSRCADSSRGTTTCPVDKKKIRKDDYRPNLLVQENINSLKIFCKYGLSRDERRQWVRDENGCREIIVLGSRDEHESKCNFSLVPCPNSKSCPLVRKMSLEDHLLHCAHFRCPLAAFGCQWEGESQFVKSHLDKCPYEPIKGYLESNQKEKTKLQEQVTSLETQNVVVQNAVLQIDSKFESFLQNVEKRYTRLENKMRELTTSLESTQKQLEEATREIHHLKMEKGNLIQNRAEGSFEHSQLRQLNCDGTFTGHTGVIWSLAVTEEGDLISASSDSTIRVWDLKSYNPKCKTILQGHEGVVHAIVVAKGNRVCSGSSDQSVRIWELNTEGHPSKILFSKNNQENRQAPAHSAAVCSLATAGNLLFSGSLKEIKIWDLDTYDCVRSLEVQHWARALIVANNQLIGAAGNVIRIWDLKTFDRVKTIETPKDSIYSLAWAPQKNFLLVGTWEHQVYFYNMANYQQVGEPLGAPEGHIGAVYALVVAGNRFYSGSFDSTIKMWNLDTRKCLQTMNRHSSSINGLAAHANAIFSASADQTIKVWRFGK